MTELYRIHFGYSASKRYPQAVELSNLMNKKSFHIEFHGMCAK